MSIINNNHYEPNDLVRNLNKNRTIRLTEDEK